MKRGSKQRRKKQAEEEAKRNVIRCACDTEGCTRNIRVARYTDPDAKNLMAVVIFDDNFAAEATLDARGLVQLLARATDVLDDLTCTDCGSGKGDPGFYEGGGL